MDISFISSDDSTFDSITNHVCIVASNASLLESLPQQLQKILGEKGIDGLKLLSTQVKPGKENGSKGETLVLNTTGDILKVSLCLLPSKKPSRHAAHGHPHAISELVSSACGNKPCFLFLLMADKSKETFSACCAIARAFPSYSITSAPAPENNIVKVFPNTSTMEVSGDIVDMKAMQKLCEGIREAASLVDMPPNLLNVNDYVARVETLIKGIPGIKISVIRGKDLESQGFGGLYGVGKASTNPPALVVLSYGGSGNSSNDKPSVVYVGKGITYDTGGLSIKSKTGMPGMKADMGGSAGCLGAFLTLAQTGGLSNDVPLHCVLCIAENSVATNATRPDDVHVFLSGKTVEINNTDAEGRLVMADGLYYATQSLNPGYLINMATLTGAQGSATGVKHSAVFTNLDNTEALTVEAGKVSGDLAHPLPYTPEFFRHEFKSPVADMKNSQKDRSNCGSAAPATFLSNHIESYLDQEKAWIHIDMAYPAMKGERATGYGVALLFTLSKALSKI